MKIKWCQVQKRCSNCEKSNSRLLRCSTLLRRASFLHNLSRRLNNNWIKVFRKFMSFVRMTIDCRIKSSRCKRIWSKESKIFLQIKGRWLRRVHWPKVSRTGTKRILDINSPALISMKITYNKWVGNPIKRLKLKKLKFKYLMPLQKIPMTHPRISLLGGMPRVQRISGYKEISRFSFMNLVRENFNPGRGLKTQSRASCDRVAPVKRTRSRLWGLLVKTTSLFTIERSLGWQRGSLSPKWDNPGLRVLKSVQICRNHRSWKI